MSQDNSYEFVSGEAVQRLCETLDAEINLLGQTHEALFQQKGKLWNVIAYLVYSVIDTSESLLLLARAEKTRDCFILSRTVFETVVNACFICAEGETAAERAQQHAEQKAYRDLTRELDINGRVLQIEWQGKIDLAQNPSLQAALDQFTGKKGREITSWTTETTVQQVEAIDAHYGEIVSLKLQFALFNLYRHSSEIAHGTLFGALFSFGLTSVSGAPSSPEELSNHKRQSLFMVLLMLNFSLAALLEVLAKEIPSLANLADASRTNLAELQSVL